MRLEDYWRQGSQVTFPEIGERGTCEYARRFAPWAEAVCAGAERSRTMIAVNAGKLALLDRYFDWRAVVPKAHRSRMGERGHRCIWHVFADAYDRLKQLELALMPPLLTADTPAREAEPDIWLGELDHGDNN